jgi:hypothetical protein
MQTYAHPPVSRCPADQVVESILRQIAVRKDVLDESKRRRKLICQIAMDHEAARRYFFSGSIAHGTQNAPLGDADCGLVLNRTFERFRSFGPDAPGVGEGPEAFIQDFAAFINPRVRSAGYPDAYVDLSGNRALKFEFNQPIEFDELGPVDPYVDLMLGLTRRDGEGLWIPNRKRQWWDAAHPEMHTWLMTERDPEPERVHRVHVVRLTKRPVKRDDTIPGRTQVMCPWNLSALALDLVSEKKPLATALAEFLEGASDEIAYGLTEDPAHVADPIKLPDGVSTETASIRLAEMGEIVRLSIQAESVAEARRVLSSLFGVEIDEIREREERARRNDRLKRGLVAGDSAAVGLALGAGTPSKAMASDGDRH